MKKYMYLKIKKDFNNTPMLCIGNRKNKRVLIDFNKIKDTRYWSKIYQKFGYRIRPNHIRLDHNLICMIFSVPSNRINKKFARRLFNSWKNGSFSLENISYDSKTDILSVTCPAYNPSTRICKALGVTKEQIWHLMRQIEPINEIALSL